MKAAFTLLETAVVLVIVCLLMLLITPLATRSRQEIAERQFWSELRVQWQAAQTRAKVSKEVTFIEPQAESKLIEFTWVDSEVHHADVKLPATLVMDWFPDCKMLETGFVSPQTARFHSTIDHQKYEMRIQLGWGGYHVVKK